MKCFQLHKILVTSNWMDSVECKCWLLLEKLMYVKLSSKSLPQSFPCHSSDALICSSHICLLCVYLLISNLTSPLQLYGGVHLPYCKHTQGSSTGWHEHSIQIWAKLAQNSQACTIFCAPATNQPSIPMGGWIKIRCVPVCPVYNWDNGINVPKEKGCCKRASELPGKKCVAQVWQFGRYLILFIYVSS